MYLETRYCGIANDKPVTRIVGQISIAALQPAITILVMINPPLATSPPARPQAPSSLDKAVIA